MKLPELFDKDLRLASPSGHTDVLTADLDMEGVKSMIWETKDGPKPKLYDPPPKPSQPHKDKQKAPAHDTTKAPAKTQTPQGGQTKPNAAPAAGKPGEPGFTGESKDKLGRTMCFQEGVRVPCAPDDPTAEGGPKAKLEDSPQSAQQGETNVEEEQPQQSEQQFAEDWAKVSAGELDKLDGSNISDYDFKDAQQVAAEQDWHKQYIEWRRGGGPMDSPANVMRFMSGLSNPNVGTKEHLEALAAEIGGDEEEGPEVEAEPTGTEVEDKTERIEPKVPKVPKLSDEELKKIEDEEIDKTRPNAGGNDRWATDRERREDQARLKPKGKYKLGPVGTAIADFLEGLLGPDLVKPAAEIATKLFGKYAIPVVKAMKEKKTGEKQKPGENPNGDWAGDDEETTKARQKFGKNNVKPFLAGMTEDDKEELQKEYHEWAQLNGQAASTQGFNEYVGNMLANEAKKTKPYDRVPPQSVRIQMEKSPKFKKEWEDKERRRQIQINRGRKRGERIAAMTPEQRKERTDKLAARQKERDAKRLEKAQATRRRIDKERKARGEAPLFSDEERGVNTEDQRQKEFDKQRKVKEKADLKESRNKQREEGKAAKQKERAKAKADKEELKRAQQQAKAAAPKNKASSNPAPKVNVDKLGDVYEKARQAAINSTDHDDMEAGGDPNRYLDSYFEKNKTKLGDRDAHGIAASGKQAVEQLTNLLDNGVDPNREFHTINLHGRGTQNQMADRVGGNSSFVLLGPKGSNIKDGGIDTVVVNGGFDGAIEDLRQAYPKINFVSASGKDRKVAGNKVSPSPFAKYLGYSLTKALDPQIRVNRDQEERKQKERLRHMGMPVNDLPSQTRKQLPGLSEELVMEGRRQAQERVDNAPQRVQIEKDKRELVAAAREAVHTKDQGQPCKQGEAAARTGCIPADGSASSKPSPKVAVQAHKKKKQRHLTRQQQRKLDMMEQQIGRVNRFGQRIKASSQKVQEAANKLSIKAHLIIDDTLNKVAEKVVSKDLQDLAKDSLLDVVQEELFGMTYDDMNPAYNNKVQLAAWALAKTVLTLCRKFTNPPPLLCPAAKGLPNTNEIDVDMLVEEAARVIQELAKMTGRDVNVDKDKLRVAIQKKLETRGRQSGQKMIAYRGMSWEEFDKFKASGQLNPGKYNTISTDSGTSRVYAQRQNDEGVLVQFDIDETALEEDSLFRGDFRVLKPVRATNIQALEWYEDTRRIPDRKALPLGTFDRPLATNPSGICPVCGSSNVEVANDGHNYYCPKCKVYFDGPGIATKALKDVPRPNVPNRHPVDEVESLMVRTKAVGKGKKGGRYEAYAGPKHGDHPYSDSVFVGSWDDLGVAITELQAMYHTHNPGHIVDTANGAVIRKSLVGGRWATVRGARVYIEGGKIVKGPRALRQKWLTKDRGQPCKQGEASAKTGCIPADGSGSGGPAAEATAAPAKRKAEVGKLVSAKRVGKGKEAKVILANGQPAPAHITPAMVPPAWTDVQISMDPDADILVKGKDRKDRPQTVYNEKFSASNQAAKFAKIVEGLTKFEEMYDENLANRNDPKLKEVADVVWLMHEQGTRPGSEEDRKGLKELYDKPMSKDNVLVSHNKKGVPSVALEFGELKVPIKDQGTKDELLRRVEGGGSLEDSSYWLKSFGATTLEGRHVVETDDGVHLQFVGKEGVWHDHKINNPKLAEMLLERKATSKQRKGKLFDTSYGKVANYTSKLDGGGFSPKDFRTFKATSMAIKEINKAGDCCKNPEAYQEQVMGIATKVSRLLGNKPQQALLSYISPTVWAKWRGAEETAKEPVHATAA